MSAQAMEAGSDARFYLSPAVSSGKMLANMRSALERGLPEVKPCKAHGLTLSVAGGGPSLEDTYKDLTGVIAGVNGSLKFLLEREIKDGASYVCGIMDAGDHIADMIVADPKVRYYVASIVSPKVFDKLNGCDVRIWHVSPESTEDPEGVERLLNDYYPDGWRSIGGGCTMGLRWINLGYLLGFRKFHLHGMDSSFRKGKTHAYPDRADAKDRMEFDGYETRPNFLAQVYDFFGTLNRFSEPDVDPVDIKLFGEGLLQSRHREFTESHVTKPLVCCIKTGDKYGPEYVINLRNGVARNFPDHNFVCFTDKPVPGVKCYPLPADLPGWWAKVGLFKLKRPLIYFDLDLVITGSLKPLLCLDRFTIIKDWWQPTYNSSVMVLTGKESAVWEDFRPEHMTTFTQGDQEYITHALPGSYTFPPNWFLSFKADSCNHKPDAALAVVFHGNPKPHELGGWVADEWYRAADGKNPTFRIRARELLSRLPTGPVVGAEIGVFQGSMSVSLLERTDLSLLMVDSWRGAGADYIGDSGDFHAGLSQESQERHFAMAARRTAIFGERAMILRKPSLEAAEEIADGSLDFVFIDADHSYEGCKADLAAWMPKLKPGGLLSGHDYDHPDFEKFGVKRAVDELGFKVELGDDMTWFIQLPNT